MLGPALLIFWARLTASASGGVHCWLNTTLAPAAGKLLRRPWMFAVGAAVLSAAKATLVAGLSGDFSAWTSSLGMISFSVVVDALSRNVYMLPCLVIGSATEPAIHGTLARVQIGSMARVCELSSAPIPTLMWPLDRASWVAETAVSVVGPASSEMMWILAPPSDLIPPAALMLAAASSEPSMLT